jgi:hypothetical protein
MDQERIVVKERDSTESDLGSLIVSGLETYSDRVSFVVGRPGLPNIQSTLRVGGAVFFETPDEGIFEVRVLSTKPDSATLLISHVSPRPGIAGGLVNQDPDNSPFMPDELSRIAADLEQVRLAISGRSDVTPEQLEYISRKLDEMRSASERLGRKDWMNLAVGTLTSVIVTTALDPTVARALIAAAGTALSWLFGGSLKLLQ